MIDLASLISTRRTERGKGIIRINPQIAAEWFIAGKSKKDSKDLLQLPEQYEVEALSIDEDYPHFVNILVSSPDIPEVPDADPMPEVQTSYCQTDALERGSWDKPDSYMLTDLKILKSQFIL